jgi:NADH dehydrogenase
VIRQLAKRGCEIRIACRDLEMANHLKSSGDIVQIVPWCWDITNPDHVATAVKGADAVINLVGVL